MLPVGALCFYQAHFGRTVLPKWPFWAHLFYSVFYSVSEFGRACFRQARVAWAMLPPGALFRAGAFAFLPCAPNSHLHPLPYLGPSDLQLLVFVGDGVLTKQVPRYRDIQADVANHLLQKQKRRVYT